MSGWSVRAVDEMAVSRLARTASVANVTARLLWLRGVRDAVSARCWLRPVVEDLHDPTSLPDFGQAVARLRKAIAERQTVLVWGHDDLDGITAVALMSRVLTDLRCQVKYYIPAKGSEKHGLNATTVTRRLGAPGLIVTVDCGITNGADIAQLARQGIDTIVTDHHEMLDSLPDAVANVAPKRPDSEYPYRGLSGVGVAFKLALGLARETLGVSIRETISVRPELLTLAVLGTIADRVPLTGENRTLVSIGMSSLEESSLPAVRAVLAAVNPGNERLTVSRFVSDLLPLFASANGAEGVERLLSTDEGAAGRWVEDLARRSQDWRREAETSFHLAEAIARPGDGIVFARSRELSLRALGHSAARLKDRYQMPAMVMGWRGDAWVGECRGIDGVNLIDLLRSHGSYFIDYGGHRKAAGFSIADQRVEDFERSAERYAHTNFAGRIIPENVVHADAEMPLAHYDPGVLQLAPFGEGNPEPLLVSEPVAMQWSERGWVADARPDLSLMPGRNVQFVPGTRCRLLYSVDDLGRITVQAVQSLPASA